MANKEGKIARVERIFAHAAVMHQTGRARNTVYCIKKSIYVLNQDHTLILRFRSGIRFEKPMSFSAGDYDSEHFQPVGDDRIRFTIQKGDYKRDKTCKAPELRTKQVAKYFKNKIEKCKPVNKVTLNTDFVACLQNDLSHIEFSCDENKVFHAVQRHIYAGSLINITKEKPQGKGTLGIETKDKIKPFKPIGIRTNDFLALFGFGNEGYASVVTFYFTPGDVIWFESTDKKMPFVGVFAKCKYDELGTL